MIYAIIVALFIDETYVQSRNMVVAQVGYTAAYR